MFFNLFKITTIIYQLFGVTFFFILFEIAFFFLLPIFGNDFYEIWFLQITVIITYITFVYSTIKSSDSRILKFFKGLVSFLMFIIIGGLFLLVIIFFETLITLKIILGVLTGYYIINAIIFIKSNKIKKSEVKLKAVAIIFLILTSCTGIIFFISLFPLNIEIHPENEPEIIFSCGTNELPNDNEILEMCKKNNVGFMPNIRESYVGNENYMQKYKTIIANEINLHFLIGGNSDFYAHIDNAHEFPLIYQNISQWFMSEGIIDSPHVTSFSVDAEPSHEFVEYAQDQNLLGTISHRIELYPSTRKIEEATKAMKEFTDLIKKDGKKSGMVQSSRFLDNADEDDDISLFLGSIYSLSIDWDFTITMLYRTSRLRYDESDDEPPEFMIKSLSLFYGSLIEGTKFTTSELSFYQNVALEERSKDDLAEEHYIFIGNFMREFKDTAYIKEREYYKDFDICRHFKNDKVFFYNLGGFLSHYGWEEIEALGQYIKTKKEWYLEYDTYKSVTFLLFYCGLIIIDILASLEHDLT